MIIEIVYRILLIFEGKNDIICRCMCIFIRKCGFFYFYGNFVYFEYGILRFIK